MDFSNEFAWKTNNSDFNFDREKEFVYLPCVWKIENFTFFFFNLIVDLNLGCFHWKHQKILVELQSF